MDKYLISSVLGFNLKVEIKDQNGDLLSSGIKRTVIPEDKPEFLNAKIFDKSFFTSFNEDLLNKIVRHRRLTE